MKTKLVHVILPVLILVLLSFSISCDIQNDIDADMPNNDTSADICEDIIQKEEKEEANATNNGNTHTIAQRIDFSEMDFSSIDKIILTDGTTGEKAELSSEDNIAVILETIRGIKGKDPISDKGYYGFTYTIELYHGDEKTYSFSLSPDSENSVTLICGYYETENGFDYPCRYVLIDCSYEYIDEVLQDFFY